MHNASPAPTSNGPRLTPARLSLLFIVLLTIVLYLTNQPAPKTSGQEQGDKTKLAGMKNRLGRLSNAKKFPAIDPPNTADKNSNLDPTTAKRYHEMLMRNISSHSAALTSPTSFAPLPKLVVLTYASNNVFKFCRLLQSAILNKIHLRVLGWEPDRSVRKTGLGYKVLAAEKAISEYDDNTVVLFVDAFDVLFAQPADVILRRFLEMNQQLVFSAEKGCWPYLDGRPQGPRMCLTFYPDSPTPYRFVNTGSWIGYVSAAKKLFQGIIKGKEQRTVGNANDQELVTDFFVCDHLNSLLRDRDKFKARVGDVSEAFSYLPGCEQTGEVKYHISLDYQCKIFQSMHNSEVDQSIHAAQNLDVHVFYNAEKRAWQNKYSNELPAVFHGNGGGKAHIEPVFEKIFASTASGPLPPQRMAPAPDADTYLHFDNHPLLTYQQACHDSES